VRRPTCRPDRIVRFRDPPDHCYLGFSTRALGEVLRMAGAVARSAAVRKPAVQSVAITTNRNDAAVNDLLTWQLVNLWRAHGLERLRGYQIREGDRGAKSLGGSPPTDPDGGAWLPEPPALSRPRHRNP